MKQSTIDGIIETFDDMYKKKGQALQDKYHSVDKFVALAQDYALSLPADNFEREMFIPYFENHVRSMYRRDYEPDILKGDRNKESISTGNMLAHYITWSIGFGTLFAMVPFALTKSTAVATTGSIVGVIFGLALAYEGSKGDRSKIVGTKQYDKQLRKELNKTLVYN